jgi:tripartite-type tricarboxylate transporter receptor subunit TctC
MHFGAVGPAIEFIRAGRLRALAVGTAERIPALPNVPTMRESGYPDFVINEFQGILAPAATPPAIVEYLGQEIVAVLRTDDIKQKFDQQGAQIVASTPEEFAAFIRDESEKWTRIAKEAGIQPQ